MATTVRNRVPNEGAASARPRARRLAPAERRERLLDAAEELLRTGGSDALRMDALARAAGVTRPVVYEHFSDRDGLVATLLDRHVARVRAHVAASTVAGPSFDDVLRSATRAYVEIACRSGAALRGLLAAEQLSPRIESARRRSWGAAADEWAVRYRAQFGLAPRDAHALAAAHLAGVSALAGLCIDGRLSKARATELHVATVLAGLTAVSPTPKEHR